MAIIGNMIASAFGGNPSVINYDMFTVVFGMLTLFYLIAIAFAEQFTFHKFVPAGLDLLNCFFYFCAAVATAAELGTHSCNNTVSYIKYDRNTCVALMIIQDYVTHNRVTNGSHNPSGRCREAQAATAFLWFTFALFVASLFFSLTSSGGVNMRSKRGNPMMSQV